MAMAQEYDPERIQQIDNQITALEADVPGLSQRLDISMQRANLSTFLVAISEVHNINIAVDPTLDAIDIINNFKDIEVSNVLIYLCKTYNLDIDFTGTILYMKLYEKDPEPPKKKEIPISYDPNSQNLTIDLRNDNLAEAFKLISDQTGKGLFFTPDIDTKVISVFIKDLPFDIAMEKLAYSNGLLVSKTKDGSFEFEALSGNETNATTASGGATPRPPRQRRANFLFEVVNPETRHLNVDIENVAIADVIYDIGNALELNIFTASPLTDAGVANVKSNDISFDQLLTKIFENAKISTGNTQANATSNGATASRGVDRNTSSESAQDRFTYKKENDVYYFGTYKQLTLRSAEVIPLKYRSISILADPQRTGRSAGRSNTTFGSNTNFGGFGNQNFNNQRNLSTPQTRTTPDQTPQNQVSDIQDLIPDDVKQDLNIIADPELNSFIVSGASADIERFKQFVKEIDRQIPIVIVEVMILEVSRNATLDAGVEWGIGTESTTTQGTIFPETGLTLGAETVNRILGRIDGSSFFNVGQVGPNFFARIRASESNGNFKIRSSPRITTLNGHRAYFSNGETSYFEITQNNFIGTQNPAISESTIFQAIDAELSLEVLPFVSADGEVTMDIKVIQSSFTGERISENGPPDISSREFSSIIKARNNDIVVLGGLEERAKNDSGSGVPFLARVPVIKWLFSRRVRTDSRSKLTVLIKPTIIY